LKPLVGFAGVLLAGSAVAEQPGPVATHITPVAGSDAGLTGVGLICETRRRYRPAPKLEVTITPPEVKIPDNAKRGTPLAKVTVRWSNGEPFQGQLRLTRNTAGICELSGTDLKLSRDVNKADDYKRSKCTVTAIK